MYRNLFGPVPSRRLGMSLGVDLIPPKICSFNCVYCECGCTTGHTLERKEYVPVREIYRELEDFFKNHPDPDYISFSGAGEPTLHSRIGEVIEFLKKLKPRLPVAVLTNGSLFFLPEVRSELIKADLVLPSLDAATQAAFSKINRPTGNYDVEKNIRGLKEFSKEFQGEIWVEVLILPGYNDDAENLAGLRKVLSEIRTQRIQLNTLDRPGTVQGLRAATYDELNGIAESWGLEQVEIIAPPPPPSADLKTPRAYRSDLESVILETLSRRPCTLKDLESMMGLATHEISKHLRALEEAGRIEALEQDRGTFYHYIGTE